MWSNIWSVGKNVRIKFFQNGYIRGYFHALGFKMFVAEGNRNLCNMWRSYCPTLCYRPLVATARSLLCPAIGQACCFPRWPANEALRPTRGVGKWLTSAVDKRKHRPSDSSKLRSNSPRRGCRLCWALRSTPRSQGYSFNMTEETSLWLCFLLPSDVWYSLRNTTATNFTDLESHGSSRRNWTVPQIISGDCAIGKRPWCPLYIVWVLISLSIPCLAWVLISVYVPCLVWVLETSFMNNGEALSRVAAECEGGVSSNQGCAFTG